MTKNTSIMNSKGIAIGVGAEATKPNQLSIKIHDLAGSTILTETEFDVLSKVLRRIDFRKAH